MQPGGLSPGLLLFYGFRHKKMPKTLQLPEKNGNTFRGKRQHFSREVLQLFRKRGNCSPEKTLSQACSFLSIVHYQNFIDGSSPFCLGIDCSFRFNDFDVVIFVKFQDKVGCCIGEKKADMLFA